MSVVILGSPGPVFADPNKQTVHSNATVTASSSTVLDGYGATEVTLYINVKASPTGTTPTLQYVIQEVDPGDGTTVTGATATSTSINAIGIQKISLPSTFGGAIKVSWTVGGGSPSFTQVYATLVGKQASVKIVDSTGAAVTSTNPTSVKITDGTDTADVTAASALKVDGSAVVQPVIGTGVLNAGNSSTTPLANGATFTGTGVEVKDYAGIGIQVFTDQVSATDGMQLQWSQDNTNWDETLSFTLSASVAASYLVGPRARYFRVVLTNGGVTQTVLRLQVILHPVIPRHDTIRLADVPSGETDVTLGKTAIMGKTTAGGGAFVDVKVNPSGALSVASTITDGTDTALVTPAGSLQVDGSGVTQPVSAASLPLPTGAATETTLAGIKIGTDKIPASPSTDRTTAAAPFSNRLSDGAAFYDAAKTGQLPAALVGGRLDENVGAWLGSTAPTVGSKTSANSVPVVIASDQGAVAISAASLPLPSGAATSANQTTLGSQTTKINDGTNTATVKAASTTVLATDTAIVVALSPNSNDVAVAYYDNGQGESATWDNTTNLNVDVEAIPPTVAGNACTVSISLTRTGTITAGEISFQGSDATGGVWFPVKATRVESFTTENSILLSGVADIMWKVSCAGFFGLRAQLTTQITGAGSVFITTLWDTSPVGDTRSTVGQSDETKLNATTTLRSGLKGSSAAALVTSSASGANHQPLDVAIYDAAGNQITSFGGGTQYTVNAVAPADPVGPTLVAERDDQLSTLSEAEGDWTQVRASAKGALWVTIPDTNGDPITSFGGGTQYTEDVAAPADPTGTSKVLVRADTPATITGTDGDWVAQRGTNYGAGFVQIVTSAGAFVDTFGGGTQYADGAVRGTATGTLMMVDDGTLVQSASGDSTGKLNVNAIQSTAAGAAAPWATRLSDGAAFYDAAKTGQLPAALVGGRLDENVGAWLGSTAPTVGSKTSANSLPVVIASDQGAVPVSGTVTAAQGTAAALAGYWPVRVTDGTNTMPTLDTVGRRGFVTITDGTNSLPTGDAIARAIFVRQTDGTNNATIKAASVTAVAADTGIVVAPRASATGTQTSVASSATSVQLLAANTARMGTIIFNDSTQVCFVKLGTTASSTSFAYRLTSNSTLEVPYGYTGRIDAIWASANGNARITEMT